ncbi:MAG: tetratricopeptide repeat protein [Bacteroidales bacterium]|nr:tetratricopeptide repeat protein [Bacteroidales bacterium]
MKRKLKNRALKFITTASLLLAVTFSSINLEAKKDVRERSFMFIEGLRMLNLGNLTGAEKIFTELASKFPDMDAAYYYLADINLKTGNLTKALSFTEKAVEADSTNYWYGIQLARIHSATGNFDKAAKVYERILTGSSANTSLNIELIELYSRNKEYDKALAALLDIEKKNGLNEAIVLTRYNIMATQGNQEPAIKLLEEFNNSAPTPRTATLLGDYYASIKRDSTAMENYTTALALDPGYIPAIFGLAEGFRMRGQFDLYFKHMFPFMSNADVNPVMKSEYMSELLSNQKFVQTFYPQVDTMMQNLYTAHSSDTSVAYNYAVFLVQTSRADSGLQVLKKNVDLFPGERRPVHQYLSLLYFLERWEDLISTSTDALSTYPKDFDFMQLKGIGELQLNKTNEAISTFLGILPLAKGDSATTVRILSILGDTYYMAGNKKESYKYYKKTIRLEPNHAPALNNYAYYLSEENKQLKRALSMSKRTVDLEPENSTYLDTYAWILHKLGKNEEAKTVLKQAMVFGGNENADIIDHYAEVLFALGEKDLAFMYWIQADKLDPSLGIASKVEKIKTGQR